MALARLVKFLSMPARRKTDLPFEEVYEQISSSGLFDLAFYRKTYGEQVTGTDPLTHFLENGLERGYLPSEEFDPVLYRVTIPKCGRSNPLMHYIQHGANRQLPGINDVFPDLIATFEKKRTGLKPWQKPKEKKLERYIEFMDEADREQSISLTHGTNTFTLYVPPPDYFFNRLSNNEPFAYVRLPHGFWDSLAVRDQIAADPRLASLEQRERLALASRIAGTARQYNGVYCEGFLDEMSEAIDRHRKDADFYNAIGFKGYSDGGEGPFPLNRGEAFKAERLALLGRYYDPDDRLYDATLWKRLAATGHIKHLPDLCRQRHVILVAPEYCRDLDRRWNLAHFTHIDIPGQLSHRIRRQLLHRVKSALAESGDEACPAPIVLTMCGGSLAFWLIAKLFAEKSDIFYMDLGQALRIWYPEVETNSPWVALYRAANEKRTVIE